MIKMFSGSPVPNNILFPFLPSIPSFPVSPVDLSSFSQFIPSSYEIYQKSSSILNNGVFPSFPAGPVSPAGPCIP